MAGYFTDKNKKLHQFAGGDNSTKYCLPVGTIFPSAIPLTDASVHLLDGSTISQTGVYQEFAELLKSLVSAGYNISCSQSDFDSAVSSTGNCGKFVIDNTSNTIRLPKITRFIQGLSNMIDIGYSVEAGLPNIEGSMVRNDKAYPLIFGYNQNLTEEGALYANWQTCSNQVDSSTGATSAARSVGFNFDASKSNSIYGNSDTVQPQATRFPYYIVLANGFVNDVKLDIDNIMNELNNKMPLTGSATRPKYNGNNLALYSDLTVKHGYIPLNSTYWTGTCNWWRVGQLMFVYFDTIVFTKQPPADPNTSPNLLTQALPKPLVNTIFMLVPHTSSKANPRMAISSYSGYLLSWWANISLNENYQGFIGYVVKDGE